VLEEGQTDDWFQSPFITTFSVLTVVGLVAFVWRSLTAKQPVVDLRVLRHRSLWAGSIMSVLIGMVLYGALFAVPIFAASVMGYSSQQTGMLLLPGAIASALTMPVAAKLSQRIDSRLLIGLGAVILTGGVIGLSHLTQTTGADQLYWPLVIRGIGTPLMFLPLSMATLGPIPKKDLPAASGFYNLTRQLGGSVGVALLTTLLARRQAFHRNVLVEKVGAIAPDTLARLSQYTQGFVARGAALVEAKARALLLLDGGVNLQAAIMSFNDSFLATASLVVLCLPLLFVLGKPQKGASLEMGH
jgi:DHA2 family multidrug resistance protein